MDLNLNFATKSSTENALLFKREQQRTFQRKEALENKFQEKRQQYIYEVEKIYLKQQELRQQELALNFNRAIDEITEYLNYNDIESALDMAVQLIPKIEKIDEIPQTFNLEHLNEFLTLLQDQKGTNNQLDFVLLVIAGDLLDKSVFQKNDDEDNDEEENIEEYEMKALGMLAKQKHRHGEFFILKLYRKDQEWFEAAFNQKLQIASDKILELLLENLSNQYVWKIFLNFKVFPFSEKIFDFIMKNMNDVNVFAAMKKTMAQDAYLVKYLKYNIFFQFTKLIQSENNKEYFVNEIIDCILSTCCFKFELFDQVIKSGLFNVISSLPITAFNYEGIENLQRIVYWMSTSSSQLLKQNIQESVWFQNLFQILLAQQLNPYLQWTTLDLLKQQLKSELGCFYKCYFKTCPSLPDNIQTQIEKIL